MQRARDIMHSLVVTCTPDTELKEVASRMKEHGIGSLPVVSDAAEVPIGMVTDRDIVIATTAEDICPDHARARDCMTSPVISAPADAPLEECVRLMGAHQVRRLPLVNRKGACVGIISLGDIVRRASPTLAAEVLRQVAMEPTD